MIKSFDRLLREEARERKEKRSLANTAWRVTSHEKIRAATDEQLNAAAKLINQPGELGYVARCAIAELERRKK